MKKIYVLDTNVLISDPSAFLAYKKNEIVVLPYKVIEELEKHKLDANELGLAVKNCTRQLISILGDAKEKTLKSGVKLKNGSTLKVIQAKELKNIEHVGPLKSGDDHILAVAVGLSSIKGNNVTLVSNDMLLTIRANSFNIASKNHYSTNNIVSLNDLYSGQQNVDVDDKVIDAYWEERENQEVCTLSKKELNLSASLSPNEFIVLNNNSSKTKRPWSMLRYHAPKNELRFVQDHKLEKLTALNKEQAMAIDLLLDPKIKLVSLMGQAGTGKTLLSIEAGLNQVLGTKRYKNMFILRPVHPVGKDIGYLPGDKKEKLEPWIAPIKDNLRFLLSSDGGRKTKQVESSLEMLFDQGKIEIEAMAYIRGRSLNDSFILIDEAQNINQHELKTILTRVGEGTKVVLTGDIEQTDRLDVGTLTNGLAVCIEKFKQYNIAGHVTLIEGVRSELSRLAARVL